MVVASEMTFDELCETHPRRDFGAARGGEDIGSGVKWQEFIFDDCTIRLDYHDEKISSSIITTRFGKIDEVYVVDSVGRVLSVRRSPNNWRELIESNSSNELR
jgi:hypothetical protein